MKEINSTKVNLKLETIKLKFAEKQKNENIDLENKNLSKYNQMN